MKTDEAEAINEILGYLQSIAIELPQAVTEPDQMLPIAPAISDALIAAELAQLPPDNELFAYRQFRVYCGLADQIPNALREITRLRELTFRVMQEGSGLAVDTDKFDDTYTHLLAWDTENQKIVGGYRLGKTDELLATKGADSVYLSEMFEFDRAFYSGSPMLEIGRSFVVPDYQKNHASLFLLWVGISQYIIKRPQYRRVYGVVSMSRLYNATTLATIRNALVEADADVTPKAPYNPDLGSTWSSFAGDTHPLDMKVVSNLVRALESGERDVPVLIRHYQKLGARFVSAAVDSSFNNTPGLLLSLHVPSMPQKYLKQYLREGAADYVAYQAD